MLIDILTLFPAAFEGPFAVSILRRAQEKKLVQIRVHDLRQWARDKNKTVDDRPYGGGVGMILKIEPVYAAVQQLKEEFKKIKKKNEFSHVVLLTPAGRVFNHRIARKLADLKHLILICGHYEGVDQRIADHIADENLSIGDYILSGGELPAMVVTEAVTRLIPGVLGKEESKEEESFAYAGGLLKYPQYTRPEEFEGLRVPEILLSGNHAEIESWRKKQALALTQRYRPDLLANYPLTRLELESKPQK